MKRLVVKRPVFALLRSFETFCYAKTSGRAGQGKNRFWIDQLKKPPLMWAAIGPESLAKRNGSEASRP